MRHLSRSRSQGASGKMIKVCRGPGPSKVGCHEEGGEALMGQFGDHVFPIQGLGHT